MTKNTKLVTQNQQKAKSSTDNSNKFADIEVEFKNQLKDNYVDPSKEEELLKKIEDNLPNLSQNSSNNSFRHQAKPMNILQAQVYFQRKDYYRAIRSIENEVIRTRADNDKTSIFPKPSLSELQNMLANMQIRIQKIDEAEKFFQEARDTDETNLRVFVDRGHMQAKNHNNKIEFITKAITEYTAVIKLGKDKVGEDKRLREKALLARADCYKLLKRQHDALVDCNSIIESLESEKSKDKGRDLLKIDTFNLRASVQLEEMKQLQASKDLDDAIKLCGSNIFEGDESVKCRKIDLWGNKMVVHIHNALLRTMIANEDSTDNNNDYRNKICGAYWYNIFHNVKALYQPISYKPIDSDSELAELKGEILKILKDAKIENPDYQHNQGILELITKGSQNHAHNQVDIAIKMDPTDSKFLQSRGMIFLKQRNYYIKQHDKSKAEHFYEEAKKTFKEVLNMDPDNISAIQHLGYLYADKGFVVKSINHQDILIYKIEKVITESVKNDQSQMNFFSLIDKDKYNTFLKHLYIERGYLQEMHENVQEAILNQRKARDLEDSCQHSIERIAHCELILGNIVESESLQNHARKLTEDEERIPIVEKIYQGLAKVQRRKIQHFEKTFKRSLSKMEKVKQYKEAREFIQSAVRIDKKNSNEEKKKKFINDFNTDYLKEKAIIYMLDIVDDKSNQKNSIENLNMIKDTLLTAYKEQGEVVEEGETPLLAEPYIYQLLGRNRYQYWTKDSQRKPDGPPEYTAALDESQKEFNNALQQLSHKETKRSIDIKLMSFIQQFQGNIHQSKHEYQKSLDLQSKAITAATSVDLQQLERGKVFQMMGKDQEALADFNEFLSRQRNNPQAQFRKGFSLKNIGDIKKATACFHKAVELSQKAEKKALDHGNPDEKFDPKLKVNLVQIRDVTHIPLFDPGHEPQQPNEYVIDLLLL